VVPLPTFYHATYAASELPRKKLLAADQTAHYHGNVPDTLPCAGTAQSAPMNRQQLLAKLDDAWEALADSYAGLTDAQLVAPGVTGDWSVKDILAHVTIWEEQALEHLPTLARGERPPRYADTHGGIDAFNAKSMAARMDLPLRTVLQQHEETHAQLVDYLQGVPEALFVRETPFRRRLRWDTYGHYARHAQTIRAWRS
jgi:hypothetical protein